MKFAFETRGEGEGRATCTFGSLSNMQPVNDHPEFFFFNPGGSNGAIVESSTSLPGYGAAFDVATPPPPPRQPSHAPPSRTPPGRAQSFQSNANAPRPAASNAKQKQFGKNGLILVSSAQDMSSGPAPARNAKNKFVGSNISLARTPSFQVESNGIHRGGGGKAPAATPQRNGGGGAPVARASSLLRPSEVRQKSRGAGGVSPARGGAASRGRPLSSSAAPDRRDTALLHAPVQLVPIVGDKVGAHASCDMTASGTRPF